MRVYISDVVGLRGNVSLFSFVGDGNCGYRAVSLALFSTQEYHAYVRFLAALEIVEYARCYDAGKPEFCVRYQRIHTSPYQEILHQALTDGQYVEMVHFYAISAALNVVLQTYIPPCTTLGLLYSPLTSMVVGHGVQTAAMTAATTQPRTHPATTTMILKMSTVRL